MNVWGNRTPGWISGRPARVGLGIRTRNKAAGPRWTPRPGSLRSLDRRVSWRCGVGCESGRLDASAVSARAERQSCAVCRNGLVAEHVRARVQIRLRNHVHLQDTHLLTRIRARPFGLAHCCQGHVNTMPGRRGEPTLFPNFLEKFFGAARDGPPGSHPGRPRTTQELLAGPPDSPLRNPVHPTRSRGSWRRTCRSSPGRCRPRERVRLCPKVGSPRWRPASRP